jgi:DNA sulfur modification protein DndB
MSSVHPAMRGRIGDSEYFTVVMPAQWVANNLVIPSEMDGWEDETIEERYQRRINYERVKSSIAPYLATDPHRFFGALIVTVINSDKWAWEPLTKLQNNLPALYAAQAEEIGFLCLSGGEVLVPLDGQHRLAALQFAISGKDEKGEPIDGFSPNAAVASDLITLMFIKHDKDRARKIFNKVNRYARPTSKADNLITSDDDFVAVLAREIASTHFGSRLVNVTSNTISNKACFVTTLSTIYSILQHVLADQHFEVDQLPAPNQQALARRNSKAFFDEFTQRLKTLKKALLKPDASGDDGRVDLRSRDLLMKPVVQLAVASAACELVARGTKSGPLKYSDAFDRLSRLDWQRENDDWQGILLNGEKVVAGETARRLATRVIAYQAGASLQAAEVKELREDFRQAQPRGSNRELPKQLK